MNKKAIILILFLLLVLIGNIFALTQPQLFYPNSTGIRINTGIEINWSSSSGSGEIIKYNIFYSNNSGTNWYNIFLNWGYINQLNNSNIEENITFWGDENQTRYIEIPKIANITSSKLNLTGYFSNQNMLYNSTTSEPESDGQVDQASTGFSLGHRDGDDYIELYLLIDTPPDANISAIEHRTLRVGTPENLNIMYNINIAETDGYLSGDPSDDNTSAYSTVKSNFNVSSWGSNSTWGLQRSVILDNDYTMNSSKKYLLWYEFVSGDIGAGSNVYAIIEETSPTNNFLGWVEGADEKYSFSSILDMRLYNYTGNTSNVWLEIGNADGIYEWNQTGSFTTTNTTTDFNSTLQYYITNNCTAELWENCTVPFILHSDARGKIQISAIDIQFTNYWWNTTNLNELTTYLINITPINSSTNGTSAISGNNFIIAHDKPNVTLNLPITNYSNSSSAPVNVDFNCSATDDFGLANVSLYITNNQNLNFSLNQTTIVSGNNSTNWTLSLDNGNYTWNCLAYDNGQNFDWGENRTIIINYSALPTEPSSSQSSSGGSGGGGNPMIYECINDLDCEKDYSCYNYACVKWFDVKIIKVESPINQMSFFNFTYLIKSIQTINGDVIISFWLEKKGDTIVNGFDTIYFSENEEKTETTQLFLPSEIPEGVYEFYVQAEYSNYSAKAKRMIEVTSQEIKLLSPEIEQTETPLEEPSFCDNVKSIILYMYNYLKDKKTYFAVGLGILILGLTLLILIFQKTKIKPHKLNVLKGMNVYEADGKKLGKVKEIYFEDQKPKIYGLLIKVDNSICKKIKKKQVFVKRKNIKSMKQGMVLDKRVSKHLEKLDSKMS